MQIVFDNGFYLIQHDATRQLVFMRRSRQALSPVKLSVMLAELISALRPLRGQRLLIDVRLGPGNNDPTLEQQIQQFRRQLTELFAISATLVATAVGRLQLTRMSRERNDTAIRIFNEESAAIAHLMAQEIATTAD